MSLEENEIEVRTLELERRDNWKTAAIQEIVRRLNALDQQQAMAWTQMGHLQEPSSGGGMKVAKTGQAGITARVGTSAGSGGITLQTFDGGTLADAEGSPVTCFNAHGSAVGASRYVMVGQDALGYYWVVSEDCP